MSIEVTPEWVSGTLAFGAADTTKSLSVTANNLARISHLKLVLPNFTNAVTATLSVEDASGNAYFSEAALAENTTHFKTEHDTTPLDVPTAEALTIKVVLSGVPGGAGGNATVTYLKRPL